MAIPQWPSSLPKAGSAGVSGGPQRNVVSFTPEIGPSIDRRRASSSGKIRDVELVNLDLTQYETFKAFFEIDLYNGILPFIWVDPLTSAPAKVKFVQSDPPYREERTTKTLYKISFQLFILRA